MESNRILLPDMPAVSGLSFRHPNGAQDAIAMAAVHAGRAAHDSVDPLSSILRNPTVEELQSELGQAATTGRLDQMLIAEVVGDVVGYASIESWHEEDGRWVYRPAGWVLPEWRGRGIGTAMLHWGEGLIRRLAAADHPEEPFEYAGSATSTEPDVQALLLYEGYILVYTDLEMDLNPAAPLPESPIPPGIEVRPAQKEHIPRIGESIGESYRYEFTNNRFHKTNHEAAGQTAWYSEPVHDRELWQVAWDGDQVIGQVLPIIQNGVAIIDEVSVRPAWRRKGLARALLLRALRDLRSRGIAVIRLDTQNEFRTRARDLYTSVGFRVVKEFPHYRKPPA